MVDGDAGRVKEWNRYVVDDVDEQVEQPRRGWGWKAEGESIMK